MIDQTQVMESGTAVFRNIKPCEPCLTPPKNQTSSTLQTSIFSRISLQHTASFVGTINSLANCQSFSGNSPTPIFTPSPLQRSERKKKSPRSDAGDAQVGPVGPAVQKGSIAKNFFMVKSCFFVFFYLSI